jgi:glycosyltransferase 2 family protein
MIKRNLNLIIGILLGIVFLVLWINLVDFDELLWYFGNYNLSSIPFLAIFYVLAYVLRSVRWQIILRPKYKMTYLYAYQVFMVGMLMNYLIPVRAGELVKSVILKNKNKVPVSISLPSIFIDKLTDLFPILLIIFLIPLLTISLDYVLMGIIIVLLLIYLLFLGFLFLTANHQERANAVLHRIVNLAPFNWQINLKNFLNRFVSGMAIMKGRTKDYYVIYLITLAAVCSEALYVYFVFRAFGSDLGYFEILFGYTLMNLTYILPTPPAQIGSNQFMWVLIFSLALGADKNLTGAAVIFSHLLTSIWIFLPGLISLLALKIRFNELAISNKNKKMYRSEINE